MAADVNPNLYVQVGATLQGLGPFQERCYTELKPCRRYGAAPHAVLVHFKQSPVGPVQYVLSLMKLGPNSAGCPGKTAKTLASVTLAFQLLPADRPPLWGLLSRSRLGHTCGCSPMGAHMDSEVKVQEGALDEEPHKRAPSLLHCLQLLQGTSEQGPASCGSPPQDQ